MRLVSFVFSTAACLTLLAGPGFAAPREPVRTERAAKAPAVPARERAKLFASDTGLDSTATVVGSSGLRHGCGNIACKNYTIMGVGF